MPTRVHREIHFSGLVQGVGFRHNASTVAQEFAVTGTVQNLSDGRVRLVVAGPITEVQNYVAKISQHGRVTETEVFELEAADQPEGFHIIR